MIAVRDLLVLVCVLAACAGPDTPAPPAATRVELSSSEAQQLSLTDRAVIDRALIDSLDRLEGRLPVPDAGARPALMADVMPLIGGGSRLASSGLLDRTEPSRVNPASVPEELRVSLEQAQQDAGARLTALYAGFDSSDPRVRVLRDESPSEERCSALRIMPPGYGLECGLAFVRIAVPFGATHTVQVKRVLERSASGWKVIARDG